MMRYRGKNSFYEGWLARCYGEKFDSSMDDAWREGWRMGDETSLASRTIALSAEIKLARNIEPAS